MTIRIDEKPAFTIHHYDGVYEQDGINYEFIIIDAEDSVEVSWNEDEPMHEKYTIQTIEEMIINQFKLSI